ncbi:PulJ/GspJ family protein [Candidatus Laterigemmans baculatus]|uniref:PulJ/GspJ family protein n=1 Tax=Candidatus Laterigemmans baculatus TaxID=2770505 RepID=UPI0013D9D095|nr:prepilin-type N-terminal cleavage/methylation domain-containing protein [Candidatus Laterigemmans baculatus]
MRFATKSPTPLRRGFTIVEMLIAMVITLLMMAALGRGFAVIGETIRTSRVEIDLSVQMREITRRLSDDLQRCTVRGDREASQQEGLGYFVYYDGPLSSASGTILGDAPTDETEQTLQDSKYSDFDDYIAFTAEAEKDNWFSGKVPRFILDMKSASLAGVPYDPGNFSGSPLDPVVITSKYAEIIYFASPQYATAADSSDPLQRIFNYNSAGNPEPLDLDGNQIPDTVRLHRRVLLIRPDLNINGALAPLSVSTGGVSYEYLAPDAWPADTTTGHPAIKTPGTHGISVAQTNRAWLMGMAVVHQQCDLSVRRVLNEGGQPTAAIAANSLADLTFPHNRFAHVRAPASAVGITAPGSTYGYSSMPLLAMGGPHALLVRAGGETTPNGPVIPPLAPSTAQVVTPLALNGFLRPEFVLGQDLTHTDVPGDGWGVERRGEDVIASNVIGFDVRGFDSMAPVFLASGADGVYGPSGGSDTPSVAGATGSDDLAITPSDPGFFETIRTAPLGTPPGGSGASDSFLAMRGAFVDLFYPFQAGGTLRGFGALRRDRFVTAGTAFGSDATAIRARANAFVRSELSGYSPSNHQGFIDGDTTKPYRSLYQDSLFKSGRMILNGSRNILLLQPAYDTFTDGYERDGFRQDDGAAIGATGFGTLWWFNHATTGVPPTGPSGEFHHGVDSGNNGIYDGLSGISMGDGMGERETLPPFAPKMPAVQITLRTENQNTRQLQQMSVVHYFGSR